MATDLGKAYVQIVPSATGISGGIADSLQPAAKAAGSKAGETISTSMAEKLSKSGEKFKSVGKKMTKYFTAPIVGGFTASTKLASDYNENLNKIDVAFGKNSKSVKDWANSARKEFGLSKVAATDAVSAFGALGKGIGLSEAESAKMSTSLAGLSADLASYFNTSNADAAKALEGIFTGESEALKRFGVVMLDTNLEKFAADQGLVWKEMSQAEKTTLRYQYVLSKTKDAQGDYSRTSDGTANSLKTFKAACEDLGTAIGTQLLPVLTPIIQKITDWIDKFANLSPATQKVIIVVAALVAAIGPMLTMLGTIMTILPVLGTAFGALAGPIGIVIAIITGLIAGGILLVKNWDKIKAAATALKKWVVQKFTELKTAALNKVKELKTNVLNLFNSIKTGIVNAFRAVGRTIKTIVSTWFKIVTWPFRQAWDFISNVADKIKNAFDFDFHLPHIKLPHFKIYPRGWQLGDLLHGSIPYLGIDWYAKGGIMTKPMVFAGGGDAGPEGIIPLNPFWEKMDSMADSIVNGVATVAAGSNGGGDIIIENYLYKGGPQLGETIVRTYDRYKKVLG